MIIRSHGENSRRGFDAPDVSGPASGAHELRLRLVMIPPGARRLPCVHADAGYTVYVVSGEADVWHGTGLSSHSVVRAGDYLYVPPGTPHLAVNRGAATSIAVVARTAEAEATEPVEIELPRHLAGLLSYPVVLSECPDGMGAAPRGTTELSPPPRTPFARGRGEPGTRDGLLLRHGTPGASLPPPAGFTASRPAVPPV